MKNFTYKEAVAAWQDSLLKDVATLRLNIAEGEVRAYQGDTLVYDIISRKTKSIEEDGSNLIAIAQQIENYKKDITNLNPGVGYIRITQDEDVEFTVYGSETDVASVAIGYDIQGLLPKTTKELLNLDITSSQVRHSFTVWLFRYTEKEEKSRNYIGYHPIDCKLLTLYKEGTIDLLTLQKIVHGGCDV